MSGDEGRELPFDSTGAVVPVFIRNMALALIYKALVAIKFVVFLLLADWCFG